MSSYFEAGSFLYNEFKLDLLTAVEFAVTVICANHQSRLERITTNGAYSFRQRTYDPTSLHMQDVESAVTVSQSKIGICLQFQCPVAVGEEKFTEATGKRERVWSGKCCSCCQVRTSYTNVYNNLKDVVFLVEIISENEETPQTTSSQ